MQPQREPMRPQPVGQPGVTNGPSRQRAAHRLRERFQWLNKFSDAELEQISFCEPGSELQSDETYFDISNPERGSFTAHPGEAVPEGACLVTRKEIPDNLWHKLTQFP